MRAGRNVLIYIAGIALSTAGALGLAGAVELDGFLAAGLFVGGLLIVILIHEWLDGPF